jgi:hypothetical protein
MGIIQYIEANRSAARYRVMGGYSGNDCCSRNNEIYRGVLIISTAQLLTATPVELSCAG